VLQIALFLIWAGFQLFPEVGDIYTTWATRPDESTPVEALGYRQELSNLLAAEEIDPGYFNWIRSDWVKLMDIPWSDLSDAEKLAVAQDLLHRLDMTLHPNTLRNLPTRERGYFTRLIEQRIAEKYNLQPSYDAADERFYRAFPELREVNIEQTAFRFVWLGVFEDVSNDFLVITIEDGDTLNFDL